MWLWVYSSGICRKTLGVQDVNICLDLSGVRLLLDGDKHNPVQLAAGNLSTLWSHGSRMYLHSVKVWFCVMVVS